MEAESRINTTGQGNRVEQRTGPKASPFTTRYLLDVQPGLVQVIRAIATTGFPLPDIQHYVHAPGGMRMASSTIEFWTSLLPDGLNSVRSEVRDSFIVDASGGYEPYGVPADVVGTFEQPFRFTGEMRDANALQYHRARYYAPSQGVWTAQDALETENRYNFANGNPVNRTDPSGYCAQPTQWWNPVDANCYYSAAGLAQRYSAGDPEAYQRWFDEFITWPWANLKLLEGLASSVDVTGAARQFLENAAIIPSLLLRDPETTLLALQIVACQNNIGVPAGLVGSVGSGAFPRPGVQPGLRVGPYVTVGLLGVLLAGLIVLPFAVPIGDTAQPDGSPEADCDPNCVVRGGVAAVGSFSAGYALRTSPPLIYGFSVQYPPGTRLGQLARAGLHNRQLSYARDLEVIAAGSGFGYRVSIPITTGYGPYHTAARR
ncbi:MAG: RHS repeat-associated core domain-containing protein [Chloroflexi bacterium]|nr:RHS repeat-associated core domain-containing protein [Chloroflexota bacterium]